MPLTDGQGRRHDDARGDPRARPDAGRAATPGDDAGQERRDRLAARVLWCVNLLGLLMLLVVFIKLDGLF